MALILLVTGVLLAGIIHSGFSRQMDPKGCIMTFMQPSYYRLLGLGPEQTKLASKYSLLLYRDEYDYLPQTDHGKIVQTSDHEWSIDKDAKLKPTGIPALFIPGNAGSAKQVRSMAKEASKYYYQTLGGGNHDSEKPSLRPIDFYSVDFNEEFTAFHGKSLWNQARYVNEAIAYILSLYSDDRDDSARPTSILLIGHSMGGIVARAIFTLDNFHYGSVDTIVTIATPHAVPPVALDYEATHIYDTITSFWTRGYSGEGAVLRNVTLVSIMGGTLDTTVNGDAANIHSIIPQSHGFTVFTSNIPHAWVGCDHLSILWCNQVASAIGQTLVQVAEAHYSGRSASVAERMAIFRRRLLTGAEKKGAEEASSMPLFTGEYFTAREFRSMSLSLDEVLDYQYLAILDRGRRFSDAGFLVAQPVNMSTTIKTVETSMLDHLTTGISVNLFSQPSLTSTLRLPNIDSSLFAYTLSVDKKQCRDQAKPQFSTMMKQSSWNMHEDRFFVNIGAKSSVININFHGDTPYHVKTSQPGKRGIELQFWTDPSCPEPLSLDLHVDLYGSLGRVLIRYRMVVLVFTYMVVILTIQSQLWNWNQGGSFQSFGNTLRQLITSSRSWNFSAALAFMAFSQSLLPTAYVEIGSNQQETDAAGVLPDGSRHNGSDMASTKYLGAATRWCFGPDHAIKSGKGFWCSDATELNVAKGLSTSNSGIHSQRAESWKRYHYMSSILVLLFTLVPFAVPGLMALARNFLVQWHEPFSADHHVYHVAPFVILTETLAHGATIATPSLGSEEIHGGIVVLLSLFGVRYTWLIYTVSWFWVSWQLLLQLWDNRRSEREKPKHE
ncbi:GPI inositol deacylase [Podila horticola]|nr:GPI inositol deacylase [Podila horticola]